METENTLLNSKLSNIELVFLFNTLLVTKIEKKIINYPKLNLCDH